MHKLSISAVGGRPGGRPARPRAHLRRSRSGARPRWSWSTCRTASCCRSVAPCALPDGAGDRAQHQPAGGGGARDRRHGDLDPDRLHRRDADELVDALRHGRRRRAPTSGERSLSRRQQGLRAVAPTSRSSRTDLIVEKKRYSAFIQGSSNIEEVLRARGLDTLLITGTVTNVCCESTARDAMMRNFKTVMITDGNAANTDEDHNAALNNFYLTFGDIMSTDFAIGCLQRNAPEGPRRGGVGRWIWLRRCRRLVLPERIELSTSPLPMECSTTELRQHRGRQRISDRSAGCRAVRPACCGAGAPIDSAMRRP